MNIALFGRLKGMVAGIAAQKRDFYYSIWLYVAGELDMIQIDAGQGSDTVGLLPSPIWRIIRHSTPINSGIS